MLSPWGCKELDMTWQLSNKSLRAHARQNNLTKLFQKKSTLGYGERGISELTESRVKVSDSQANAS